MTHEVLQQQFGNERSTYCKADITKPADVENAVRFCVEKFGRLDIMVSGNHIRWLNPAPAPAHSLWERRSTTLVSVSKAHTREHWACTKRVRRIGIRRWPLTPKAYSLAVNTQLLRCWRRIHYPVRKTEGGSSTQRACKDWLPITGPVSSLWPNPYDRVQQAADVKPCANSILLRRQGSSCPAHQTGSARLRSDAHPLQRHLSRIPAHHDDAELAE